MCAALHLCAKHVWERVSKNYMLQNVSLTNNQVTFDSLTKIKGF